MGRAADLRAHLVLVDADNTLWDTDGVFALAQLHLLDQVELQTGVKLGSPERLQAVRAVDQALAEKHHLRLRYPPRLLAAALSLVLQGAPADVAVKDALKGQTGASLPLMLDLETQFLHSIQRPPTVLPGVRKGLQRLRQEHITVAVITEGSRARVLRTVELHSLTPFIDRVVEAQKTERFFKRIADLRRLELPAFMVGDQLSSDIMPAKKAGLLTIYVPSRFRPKWEEKSGCSAADFCVGSFDEAADLMLERLRKQQ